MIYKITELLNSVTFSTKQVCSLLTVPFSEQGPKYVPKELSIKDFIKYEKSIYRSTVE
jgi:hypothetical protein